MSDDLLISNGKPVNLGLLILDGLPKLSSQEDLIQQLHTYANEVARQTGDFKQSAEVRKVLENPESAPAKFAALINACKCKLMASVMAEISKQFMITAQGCFAQAMGSAKFEPVFMLPDNDWGQYIFEQLTASFEGLGIVKPGDIKPIQFTAKPPPIIKE